MVKKKTVFQYQNRWWFRSLDRVVLLSLIVGFFFLYPGQNIYTVFPDTEKPVLYPLDIVIPSPAPYPQNQTGIYPGPEISATAVVALDVDSGVYLYKRNEQLSLAPASTTKIMTALVALDLYALDDVLTVKTASTDGQTMGLVPGERITVENLLFGVLIHSGNDAAYTLSDNYSGGIDGFVVKMNEKARALHLTDSSFTNPAGYDDPNHKTTARDLARLAQAALGNKTIAKMVAIPQITVSDVTHTYFHLLHNVNALVGRVPGVGGIKTGWTELAGENLVTLVERNGHPVILIVLQSQDRFRDTLSLIDWVYGNYEWIQY